MRMRMRMRMRLRGMGGGTRKVDRGLGLGLGGRLVGGRARGEAAATGTGTGTGGNETLYDLLGVAEGASAREIKRAYRKLAKTTHPDVEGGDANKFKRIAKAYAVLSNDEARKEYDRKRRAEKIFAGGSVDDAFDFFATGGGGRRGREEPEFYGFADLFRDIEEEFSAYSKGSEGQKGDDAILRKLGEDLLDFLEGKTSPSPSSSAKGSGSRGASSGGAHTDPGSGEKASTGAARAPGSSAKPSSKASFDADQELRELKKQMGLE
ncbi:DnaJ-like protein [Chloropicon primus]|uniref:DnaJ-like protein n=1 Tax=Chloropicon primus TaxID=1764295 RepID=A0A5B8MKM7_9CHLO|nr:DnaJ-like protein [Chloropicon primus]UPR00237.1 DnaJ-like protein [Chloropicon primus]|eukprot:QDZ21026.1 DnaJ-like protein [Chloropicon primus]